MNKFILSLCTIFLLSCNDYRPVDNNNNNNQNTSSIILIDTTPMPTEFNTKNDVQSRDLSEGEKKAYEYMERKMEEAFPKFYKIGSKPSVVIKVQGQPTRVIVSGPYKTFFYGISNLTFYNNHLESYDNIDGSLKIKIED